MTILFILHYSGYYGANKSLLTLITLLRERYGITPVVLLPNYGVVCDELDKAKIEYRIFHYYWWVNDNHGLFQWLLNKRKQLRNWFRVKRICSVFADKSFDLVYTNSICVNMGYLIAKRLGLPHIWHLRENFDSFSLTLSLSLPRSLAIWASPINTRYLLISDFMMDSFQKYLPIERMVRVYNGVSLPSSVYRKSKNYPKGRLQICCVGVLSSQKNQLELLKAQSILLQRNTEVDVWIVGSGKQDYSELLHSFVKQNGLEQFVHFTGHSDDVFGILQEMNLGVVCARDEAFGRVTVEFMLMQMPVIVSRSGANAELIESGLSGDVYPLGNIEALADSIEQYVRNPDLVEMHGRAGELVAKRNFSAENNAEMVFNQIQSVLRK